MIGQIPARCMQACDQLRACLRPDSVMEFGFYIAAHAHRHSQGRLDKDAVQSRLKIASHLQRIALHCTTLMTYPMLRFIATLYS